MNKKIVRQVCLAVLFPLFMLMPSHQTHAQEAKVTMDMQEAPMKRIMAEIERQTSYLFGVSEGVDVERKITLKVTEVSVKHALDRLVEQAGDLAYEISGANIFLKYAPPCRA